MPASELEELVSVVGLEENRGDNTGALLNPTCKQVDVINQKKRIMETGGDAVNGNL